jgi:hypothetical protein
MNGINYKPVLSAFLLLLITLAAKAQELKVISSLNDQMRLYAKKMQSPVLFVHFDKNVYTNNESIWFTAYLMNYTNAGLYHTLSLALVRDADRTVVMEDRFVMGKGVCFGNTIIPDTVAPGNYTFLVTTNRLLNGKVEMVFAQPVTIKALSDPVFIASLNPLDTAASNPEQKVMLLVSLPEHNPNRKVPPPQIGFKYYVGTSTHPLIHGEAKTEKQYNFTIPSRLLVPGNNLLHVQLSYKGETRDISIALPARPRPAVVHFFPEGGNLVTDLSGTVGLEVRTAAGVPLGTSAFLYDNDKVMDTLQTNSYGLGQFTLTPRKGHNYSLRLYNVIQKDTSYSLPESLITGPAITIVNAVVNDTLTVVIKDNRQEKLYLTGHNYREIFFMQKVNMTSGMKTLKLVISALPKGLAELTLTDSLGRPFAERLFFAHYDKREPLMITTDKDTYTTRQKVNVKIRLDAPLPDSAFVSIACVQENRVSVNKKNDIESYLYLKHELGELPVRDGYLTNSEGDKNFLENILLVKGWSRYAWMDVLKATPKDTIKQNNYLSFGGNVNWIADPPPNLKGDWLGEPIKYDINIVNLAHPLDVITTTKTGAFTLVDSTLLTLPGKWVNLMVVGKDPRDYKTIINDPYASFNKALAARTIPQDHETKSQENSNYLEIPANEHAHQLKEVRINGSGDDALYRNECGDYVCRNDVLNCTNHPHEKDNRPPVKGNWYYISPNLVAGNKAQYLGCIAPNAGKFKGVYSAQEFYPADYSRDTTGVSDYQSTIYWKHRLKVSSLKDAEISFPTSDITGRYKIVVQGVTGNDVVYGETVFNVKRPM